MSTRRTRARQRLAALPAAARAALERRRRRRGSPVAEPPAEASPAEASPAGHGEVTCACGQAYGTSGSGRHRVLWPAEGGPADAVLGDRCPNCDRPFAEADAVAER